MALKRDKLQDSYMSHYRWFGAAVLSGSCKIVPTNISCLVEVTNFMLVLINFCSFWKGNYLFIEMATF